MPTTSSDPVTIGRFREGHASSTALESSPGTGGIAEGSAPKLPTKWKVTAAKIAEKFGHKAALTEIMDTNAEKIHAEISKKKKKAARRRALGY